jgi:hypothetical protein
VARAIWAARTFGVVEDGERMLLPCRGGPSVGRAERYPPRLEIPVEGGVYVLVDEGPVEHWSYEFVPGEPP